MSYKVAVRPDGKAAVPITVDASRFKIQEHYEGGILLELTYRKGKLHQHDAAGLKALLGAWPTVDEVVLYRKQDDGEWQEAFAGLVTAVDADEDEVEIAAHMVDVGPPNPLTVAVQEDTDDLSRFTVLVTADNDGEGTVALSFGDGSTATGAGDGSGANQHAYVSPGTYTVTATSNADPGRTASQVVVIPFTS